MYRGRVTRITVDGVFVEVPKLGLGVEYGPCEVMSPFVDMQTDPDGAASHSSHLHAFSASDPQGGTVSGSTDGAVISAHPDHIHGLTVGSSALASGDRVLLTSIGGIPDDLVILGVLP
jgi:hypothetical protein